MRARPCVFAPKSIRRRFNRRGGRRFRCRLTADRSRALDFCGARTSLGERSRQYAQFRLRLRCDAAATRSGGRTRRRPHPRGAAGDPRSRHRAALLRHLAQQQVVGRLCLPPLRTAAVPLRREVRKRHRLAELHHALRSRPHPQHRGSRLRHGAGRDTLRPLRRPSRPRLPGRAAADRPSLLPELRVDGILRRRGGDRAARGRLIFRKPDFPQERSIISQGASKTLQPSLANNDPSPLFIPGSGRKARRSSPGLFGAPNRRPLARRRGFRARARARRLHLRRQMLASDPRHFGGYMAVSSLTAVENFIASSAEVHSLEALEALVEAAVAALGFDYFAIGYHIIPRSERAAPVGIVNYPESWRAELRLGLADDPVARAAERRTAAFAWDELPRILTLTPLERQRLARAARHGLVNGYTIPSHVPGEALGSSNFAMKGDRSLPRRSLAAAAAL